MKSLRLPFLVFAVLLVAFFSYLNVSSKALPERVATHFDGAGHANGWMNREEHVQTLGLFGFIVPGCEILLFYVMRFKLDKALRLPNRDYWLAPERRDETMLGLVRSAVWLGCLTVGFFGIVQWTIVMANFAKPPYLQLGIVLGPTAGFLACVSVWAWLLMRRFKKVPL